MTAKIPGVRVTRRAYGAPGVPAPGALPKRPVGRPRTSTLTFVGLRIPRPLLARVDAEAERRRVAGEGGASRSAVIVEATEAGMAALTGGASAPE